MIGKVEGFILKGVGIQANLLLFVRIDLERFMLSHPSHDKAVSWMGHPFFYGLVGPDAK